MNLMCKDISIFVSKKIDFINSFQKERKNAMPTYCQGVAKRAILPYRVKQIPFSRSHVLCIDAFPRKFNICLLRGCLA